MVHHITPNLNSFTSDKSCDFQRFSEELQRWKDVFHNGYMDFTYYHTKLDNQDFYAFH